MQFHEPKRLAAIKCPLCKRPNDIIVNGLINNFDGTWGVDEDTGYAFCICRNIFYTDWANINMNLYKDPKYTKDYYKNKEYRKHYAHGAKAYFPIILEELGGVARFLEVGFGMDSLLDEAAKLGWETNAIDVAPRKCKKKHNFVVGNFETNTIRGKYDVIWAAHTFEHFKDPIKALRKCHRILRTGGYLFISMPDPLFIDWKDDPYTWTHWVHKEHHIMWDMDSFIDVVKEEGFEIIRKIHNLSRDFTCHGDFHILGRKRG